MSSWPGSALEDFLMWQLDLIVDGYGGSNPSLQIAEALGVNTRRRRITQEQFVPIVEVFEPYREKIERRLTEYDEEESGSWRDYAGYNFDFIPDDLYEKATAALKRQAEGSK